MDSSQEQQVNVIASERLTAWPMAPQCVVVTCHDNLTTPDVPPWELAKEFKAVYNAQFNQLWKLDTPETRSYIKNLRESAKKELG